jgi:hypothetical protein
MVSPPYPSSWPALAVPFSPRLKQPLPHQRGHRSSNEQRPAHGGRLRIERHYLGERSRLPRAERDFFGETGRQFGVSVSRLTDRESELTYARDAFCGMEAGEPRIAVILMPLPDMRRILPRVIGS